MVSGLGWTALAQITKQSINVLVSLVLARLTGPAAYGLIGMVTIFTGFATLFVDLGLGSALIQRAEIKDEHTDSVFWINILVGTAIAVVSCLFAPLIAQFYHQPAVTTIMRVCSLGFIFGAAGTAQSALLSREMRFRELAKIDAVASALSGLLGIWAALKGFGVWSLVLQTLTQSFVKTAGLWYASTWRPRSLPRFSGVRDLAHFGGNLFVFNVFNYWIRNLDNLLIGRYIGTNALGLYSRAYQLMLLPVQQLSNVSGNVMFPALASVQHDIPRVRSIYLRSISAMHLIAAPIYAGLFAVADTFVFSVLGDQWLDAVPLLRILCIVGFFQPVGSSTGWIYMALGRADIMMKWSIFTGVLFIGGFIVGLHWGLLGVTWSYCVAGLISWYPGWSLAGRLVGLSFGAMLMPLIPASLCAIGMGAFVWVLGYFLKSMVVPPLVLALQVFGGASFYVALVAILRLKSWQGVVSRIGSTSMPPES